MRVNGHEDNTCNRRNPFYAELFSPCGGSFVFRKHKYVSSSFIISQCLGDVGTVKIILGGTQGPH